MPLLPIPAWTRKGSQVSLNDLNLRLIPATIAESKD